MLIKSLILTLILGAHSLLSTDNCGRDKQLNENLKKGRGYYDEQLLTYSVIPLPGRQERRSLLMVEFKDYIFYSTHLNNRYAGDRHGSVMIIDYEVKDAAKPVFL